MKQLFTGTRNVTLDIYDECKYTATAEVFENEITVCYKGVTGFEVVTGEAARRIEEETDGTSIDDLHEYLVLFFADGTTSTFRNSYVDLFIR